MLLLFCHTKQRLIALSAMLFWVVICCLHATDMLHAASRCMLLQVLYKHMTQDMVMLCDDDVLSPL
jgi:hypothetical protein